MKIYNKLVRDKIPKIIEASGKTCAWETLDDEGYLRMLDAKLNEELAEYQVDKSIEELADLLEVMRAVVTARGWTWDLLEQVRFKKAYERGGFEERLLLKSVIEPESESSLGKSLVERINCKQDAIFDQLKKSAIEDYFWIQDNYLNCDVSSDALFIKRFGHFYQMRFVSQAYRKAYFSVFESAKHTPMSFETIAETLYPVDGNHQFSFITKMLHTLDTDKPIYDSLVDTTVGIHRKSMASLNERLVSDRAILNELSALYYEMISSGDLKSVLDRFEKEYPGRTLSDVKKVDFLLWALGAVERKENAGV